MQASAFLSQSARKLGVALALGVVLLMPVYAGAQEKAPAAHTALKRPLVVKIYSEWCQRCRRTAPTWYVLQKVYQGKVDFVLLDVTTGKRSKEASKTAATLGIGPWFEKNKTQTSLTAVVDPATNKTMKVFFDEPNPKAYQAEIDKLLK